MKQVFENNINQVQDIFNKVFNDINPKDFVREYIKVQDISKVVVLTKSDIDHLKKAMDILVQNARVEQTRKMQQKFFMDILTIANNEEEFLLKFNNDSIFCHKFLMLLIVFLDKNNLHDKDASHHIHIAKIINAAAMKI